LGRDRAVQERLQVGDVAQVCGVGAGAVRRWRLGERRGRQAEERGQKEGE
jgi:hypothetical protein